MKNSIQASDLIDIGKCVKLISWANDVENGKVPIDLDNQELASCIMEFYKDYLSRMVELKALRKYSSA